MKPKIYTFGVILTIVSLVGFGFLIYKITDSIYLGAIGGVVSTILAGRPHEESDCKSWL